MQPLEKQIILREIELWKTSRLLPREYCDFLLNLYLEGELTANQLAAGSVANSNAAGGSGAKKLLRVLLFALMITIGIAFLQLFHMFPYMTQVCIMGAFMICLSVLTGFSKHKITRLVFMAFLSILCLVEAYIVDEALNWPLNSRLGIIPLIVAACGWILVGMIGRSKWIASLGVILLILLVNLRLLLIGGSRPDYLHQHLFAIGIMVLAAGTARLSLSMKIKTSVCWVIGSVCALFLPDLNEWFVRNPTTFMREGILFLKVLLLLSFIVVWRERISLWWKL